MTMQQLTATDRETQSADVVADNLAQLQTLFPEAFSEGKVHFEVLKQLLGGAVDESDEKYGLNWHGKRRARQLALTASTGTLRPRPEESVDWETTQNLMIEGDNLEVLKLLQKSYAGKVKLIYIDPPYNTGKDFVYPDNFRDSIGNYLEMTGQVENGAKLSANTDASGRFHTDWLNMIYPRIRLGRSLLREDGFFAMSLDDGEISNARKVCDEIFGEENFIDCMVWKKRYGGGAKEKYLVTLHEYILFYAKSLESIPDIEVPLSESSVERYYTMRDEYYDERGPYRIHPLEAMKSFEDRPNLCFPIPTPDGETLLPKRQWRWSQEKMSEALGRGEVAFLKAKDGGWTAHSKQYLKNSGGDVRSSKAFSIIDGIYTQAGTSETVEMFGDARVFSFPKPSQLIRRIIEIATSNDKDAIVLDYFAGSGTTGQAVMEQNAVDAGNRRFILVQLPEPLDIESKEQNVAAKYCDDLGVPRRLSELTKERVRRSGTKVKSENPMFSGDVGFKTFRLDKSNICSWSPDSENLAQSLIEHKEHLLQDRLEVDIVYELLLKLGLDLCVLMASKEIAGKTVEAVGAGVLMLCLAEKISAKEVETLAAGIVAWHKALAPTGDSTVVFRDSAFADDVAKTNMAATLAQNGLENVRSL